MALLAVAGLGLRAWGSVTATATISGAEQPGDVNAITLSFNGFTETVPYGQYSTPASIASAFGAVFSRDYLPHGLCAIANGPVVSFKLQSGSFSALTVTGPANSFQVTSSGFAPQGGTADSGTITLTVGGVVAAQTNYGAGATTESVAAGLAAEVTSNSYVTVTAEGSAVQLQSKQVGSATNYSYTLATTSYDSTDFSQPSFMNPSASGSLEGGSDGGGAGTPQTIYSYVANYDGVGDLHSYNDSVTGGWTFGYDNLNRLTGGSAASGPWSSLNMGWSYDSFGNRTAQTLSGSPQAPAPQPGWATYTTNTNRMDATNQNPNQQKYYDASGDVINDGINQYAYDAEGRVCAVYSGVTEEFTGYIYDGLGNRIAKGTLDPMKVALPLTGAACDITKNGFVKTNVYVPGPNGEQLDEADSNMNLQHSNIYANSQLLATATPDTNLHYAFNDWLGTKRVVTSASGTVEETCLSLPFGDELDCNGSDPSEQHFTGKERDTESGNDYFGARYYASAMGRFLSPDPSGLFFADPSNPQSLNLYSYVQNNPLTNTDPTGEECVWDDGSFDSADDPNTGSQAQCEGTDGKSGAGGHWVDSTAFATLGLGDWSDKPNSTLAGMMGQLQDTQSVTVTATTAVSDLITSSVNGLSQDFIPQFDMLGIGIMTSLQNTATGDPYRFFSTKYCGPGGAGNPTGFLDAACKAHDACYKAAGITYANNLPGGPSMSSSQASAAKACNQALYNAARINNSAPGSKAAQYWLTQGANLPFGAYIIKPGTEATPW